MTEIKARNKGAAKPVATSAQSKPPRPAFLSGKAAHKRKGFATMMENWDAFVKVPLTYVKEEDLKELLETEIASRKRWAMINRLHSAYNVKRVARERAELRKSCGLD